MIATARASGSEAGRRLLWHSQNQNLVSEIQSMVHQILDDMRQETEAIIAKQTKVEGQTVLSICISGGTVFVLLLVVLFILMHETMRRMETENILKRERNIALEGKAKDEAILKCIGDGVFALDPHNTVMLFNQAAEKISGLTAKQVIGKHMTNYCTLRPKTVKRGRMDRCSARSVVWTQKWKIIQCYVQRTAI